MNVLYAATRNLYPYLKGAIKSLLAHNTVKKLYIFAEDDKLPFEIPCDHKIINVSEQKYFPPDGPNMDSIFTYMAMMRICAPDLLRVAKVIWLDVDTIVCDSLEPLWEIPLDGKWIAWCPERFNSYRPYGPMYYNIGVCVMNLSQMRKDKVTQRAVEELNREKFWCTDQCVMNKITPPEKMAEIPIRYNECFCCGTTNDPAIVHYAGIRRWYDNHNIFRWEYAAKYAE